MIKPLRKLTKSELCIALFAALLLSPLLSPPLWSQDSAEVTPANAASEAAMDGPKAVVDAEDYNPEDSEGSEDKQQSETLEPGADFKPDEEISEDFPIPLPSDI